MDDFFIQLLVAETVSISEAMTEYENAMRIDNEAAARRLLLTALSRACALASNDDLIEALLDESHSLAGRIEANRTAFDRLRQPAEFEQFLAIEGTVLEASGASPELIGQLLRDCRAMRPSLGEREYWPGNIEHAAYDLREVVCDRRDLLIANMRDEQDQARRRQRRRGVRRLGGFALIGADTAAVVLSHGLLAAEGIALSQACGGLIAGRGDTELRQDL